MDKNLQPLNMDIQNKNSSLSVCDMQHSLFSSVADSFRGQAQGMMPVVQNAVVNINQMPSTELPGQSTPVNMSTEVVEVNKQLVDNNYNASEVPCPNEASSNIQQPPTKISDSVQSDGEQMAQTPVSEIAINSPVSSIYGYLKWCNRQHPFADKHLKS